MSLRQRPKCKQAVRMVGQDCELPGGGRASLKICKKDRLLQDGEPLKSLKKALKFRVAIILQLCDVDAALWRRRRSRRGWGGCRPHIIAEWR